MSANDDGTGAPLQDETAIVTGASSGIGRETARALAAEGANVVVAARREQRLRELVDDVEDAFDATALAVPTDVTDEAAVEALVEAAVDRFDELDVVVNNAGLGRSAPVEELPTEDYRRMMDVNVDGMFFLTRASVPHLRESRGNLIFLGSFAGQYPRPAQPVYAATKWWTRGIALSLAAGVGADGIAVTVINPTEVRTAFGGEDGDSMAAEFEPGDVTEPADVADAIVFAARQEPPNAVTELDLFRRNKLSHF